MVHLVGTQDDLGEARSAATGFFTLKAVSIRRDPPLKGSGSPLEGFGQLTTALFEVPTHLKGALSGT